MKKFICFLSQSWLFSSAWESFGACLIAIAILILAGMYAIYKASIAIYKASKAICRWLKKAEKAMDIYIEKNKSS